MFFSISKGGQRLNGCSTSMSVSAACPSDPHTGLWTVNGTRWDLSDAPVEWPTEKYSVVEDSESVTAVVRLKSWPHERLKVRETSFLLLLYRHSGPPHLGQVAFVIYAVCNVRTARSGPTD